jgi:hypothetical protein
VLQSLAISERDQAQTKEREKARRTVGGEAKKRKNQGKKSEKTGKKGDVSKKVKKAVFEIFYFLFF